MRFAFVIVCICSGRGG